MIQYYLSGVTEPEATLEYAKKIKLGYAFDEHENAPFSKRGVMANGPDGKAGVCISHSHRGLGYFPERQTWAKHKSIANVWVGVEKGGDPLDYIRKDWKGDHRPLVTESWPWVSQYRLWHVPVARVYGETLPHEVDFDGKDFVRGEIVEQFRRLDEIGHNFMEHYQMEPCSLPGDYVSLLFEVFSAAYLIGKQEFSMLSIAQWEPTNAIKIVELFIDIPGYIERDQKKTDIGQEDSETGFLD